ncbi:conserved exported protein of unknown function [Hyphomicrobium sp. MC1]|nr:conserved exported protein of unknown function [Hyphomicrobium sp. MC1]
MHKFSLAVSVSLLALGFATAASAHARCDGDFQFINGSWIATRYCQRAEAEHVARAEHTHITHHTVSSRDETPEEFCRWHNGQIETDTYCSSYND